MEGSNNLVDCLIVGGGPAGLTTAIYLARYRRKVVIIDDGKSRAALIPKTHNYPGFASGISGSDLLEQLHRQLDSFSLRITTDQVSHIEKSKDGFVATCNGHQSLAKRIVLATGLIDKSPAISGFKTAIEAGFIRFCPICDGYEASDQRICVLGPVEEAAGKALFLRTYSEHVTLLTQDGQAHIQKARDELRHAGVRLLSSSGLTFERRIDGLSVQLDDGTRETFDSLYPVLGCTVRSQLGADLGAALNEVGCLEVDSHQQTTVRGVYAVGDVVSDLHQIAVGTGHAAIAATHLHNSLPRNFR
jgi:thioredoxin reductase (NADPH)